MFDIFCKDCEYKETVESVGHIVWKWVCPACGSRRPPYVCSSVWKDMSEGKSSYNQALPQSDGDSNDLTAWPAWRKNEHRSE